MLELVKRERGKKEESIPGRQSCIFKGSECGERRDKLRGPVNHSAGPEGAKSKKRVERVTESRLSKVTCHAVDFHFNCKAVSSIED